MTGWHRYRLLCTVFAVAFSALSIWNVFAGDVLSGIIAGLAGAYFGLRASNAPHD